MAATWTPSTLRDLSGPVSVADYGVHADGVTDDTAAIQAALTAAGAIGGTLLIPPGQYAVSSVSVPAGVRIEGHGATLKKMSGGAATYAVTITGTQGASSLLGGNVAKGATTATVASGAAFAAGQYVLLQDATWKFTSPYAGGRNQEIVRIQSVVGTTLTFQTPTIGAYTTAATGTAYVLNAAAGIVLSGLTVANGQVGNDTGGLITCTLAYGLTLRDVALIGPASNPAFNLDQSQWVTLTGCTVRDGRNSAVSGYGYGLVLGGSSAFVTVTGCHFENLRENMFTENARHSKFVANTGHGLANELINTHGGGCERILIDGNVTSNNGSYGFSVGNTGTSDVADDVDITISNNKIISPGSHGIIAISSQFTPRRIQITGNQIIEFSSGGSQGYGIYAYGIREGSIQNNYITAPAVGNGAAGMRLAYLYDVRVSGNSLVNIPNSRGITYQQLVNTLIEGNTVKGNYGECVKGEATNTNLMIRGNDWGLNASGTVVTAYVGDEAKVETNWNTAAQSYAN